MSGIDVIDITMVAYKRVPFTQRSIEYLHDRTKHPFRLTLVVNGWDELTNEEKEQYREKILPLVDHAILLKQNYGIHAGKNAFLPLVRSEFFVDFDNDILVPRMLNPDWLDRLIQLMYLNSEYAAIAMRPQVLVGDDESKHNWTTAVTEFPWVGAHGRIMRTDLVKKAGGWRPVFDSKRNNEERWIAEQIKKLGDYSHKFGYTTRVRCYHMYGDDNWGYGDMPIDQHGHYPIWPPTSAYEKMDDLDPDTFQPKNE